jgi:transposase
MDRGNFTEYFRIDAVNQITEGGYSVAEVSKRLGVTTHSLYAWMKVHSWLPAAIVKKDQSAEILRLKHELARAT